MGITCRRFFVHGIAGLKIMMTAMILTLKIVFIINMKILRVLVSMPAHFRMDTKSQKSASPF
jgi:hypothetical protein